MTPAATSSTRYWRTPLDRDLVKTPRGEVNIITDRCKGCGFCVEYCPRGVLAMSPEFNRKGYHPPHVVKHDECVNCNLCEMICPDFAIFCLLVEEETAGSTADAVETPIAMKEDES